MNCNNCGTYLTPGQETCPNCGARVSENTFNGYNQTTNFGNGNAYGQQAGFNQANGFGQSQGNGFNQGGFSQGGSFGAGGMNQNRGSAPEFAWYLIVGIVYCICCCNLLAGILGIVFTVLMNNAFKAGDMLGYTNNKKVAKIIYIVGIALIIITLLVSCGTGILNINTISAY